ncbi:hypothetical protein KO506_13050 [Polaribacter vadi]|uniref:hypothetical protein n=1 Tax=Polaribacter TaxID=52959 RepID=UPI001C09FEC3|nr:MULTISPECIES: hypothetical protein [Polaribacter]MBU3012337.1 hypothetical protein [Polaribacter vadi]MDO6742154.1 hypothetical protein [Polaribacter sp. 1_MG-2023]
MKTLFKYLIVLLMPCMLFSQSEKPTEAINGTYYLMAAEKGIGSKMTKEKLFQYTAWGNDNVLIVAACEKCSPVMYKYNKEESEAIGVPVFYNAIGLYMITYDDESFIMLVPANKNSKDWTDFTYSNFYSKNKAKADAMTKQKIVEFIDE